MTSRDSGFPQMELDTEECPSSVSKYNNHIKWVCAFLLFRTEGSALTKMRAF